MLSTLGHVARRIKSNLVYAIPTIRRFLTILVVVGLALAPLSRPAMSGSVADVSAPASADESSPSAMMDEMASEMPCCPSKAPAPLDCDKCVFMAACMAKYFAAVPASASGPVAAPVSAIVLIRDDPRVDGLGHPPPEHPPRSLV